MVYYILLGVWCLVGFLVMKEKQVLRTAEKYVGVLIPFLYTGLGVYIVIKSHAYPWSIEHINTSTPQPFGKAILATMTVLILLLSIGIMVWFKLVRKGKAALQMRPSGKHTHLKTHHWGLTTQLHMSQITPCGKQ